MYNGKFSRRRKSRKRLTTMVVSLLLMATMAIGGTAAYFLVHTEPVENTFTPSEVDCKVEETFENNVKTNVNVTNTGNIKAYLRVKLVTYRVNKDGQHIGGDASLENLTIGKGWFPKDGFYYYQNAVEPDGKPAANLIDSITLRGYENGERQVLEVMAEAIQAQGTAPSGNPVITEVWGVGVGTGDEQVREVK